MALKRSNRLSKTRHIEAVFRRSQRAEGRYMSLYAHWKRTLPGRALVIVSKKVSKKASRRSLLRRRLVEWLRVRGGVARAPVDCIISLKPGASEATRRSLVSDLESLVKKIKLHSN